MSVRLDSEPILPSNAPDTLSSFSLDELNFGVETKLSSDDDEDALLKVRRLFYYFICVCLPEHRTGHNEKFCRLGYKLHSSGHSATGEPPRRRGKWLGWRSN
jgi:hypothetical protein